MQECRKFDITRDNIVALARHKKAANTQLVMIHGYVDAQGDNVISYEYAAPDGVDSYTVVQKEKTLPSISAIYDAAAAWPEKELEELMGMEFTGLDMPGRLFLPDDLLDERGQILVTPLAELRDRKRGE